MPQRSDISRKQLKKATAELLLTKSLDSITVRDLVNTAGIGRSTFYRNFEDKDDFLAWLQTDLAQEIASLLAPKTGDPEPNFHQFYDAMQDKRDFMRAFLTQQRWPNFVAELEKHATAHYEQALSGRQFEVPTRILARFMVGANVNLFLYWLQSDKPESPEKMATYHRKLGRNGVLKSLGTKML